MDHLPAFALADLDATTWVAGLAITFAAGFIKGVAGLALPLVYLTGLTLILPVHVAIAVTAIPALVTNVFQSQRGGTMLAVQTFRQFWVLNLVLLAVTLGSTQLVVQLDERPLLLILGIGAFTLGLVQASGWPKSVPLAWRKPVEVPYAMVGGFFGGLAGLWGTVLITYYLALRLDKGAFIRATGVSWLVASVPYTAGHIQNGVLNWETAQLSALALAPTLIGMRIGQAVQDRLNQNTFRRIVFAILLIATLNLIRRGLWG